MLTDGDCLCMIQAKVPQSNQSLKGKINLLNEMDIPMAYGLIQVDVPNSNQFKVNENTVNE